jgi:hypothetical protein
VSANAADGIATRKPAIAIAASSLLIVPPKPGPEREKTVTQAYITGRDLTRGRTASNGGPDRGGRRWPVGRNEPS